MYDVVCTIVSVVVFKIMNRHFVVIFVLLLEVWLKNAVVILYFCHT